MPLTQLYMIKMRLRLFRTTKIRHSHEVVTTKL